jgi:hypothetical protein
LDDFALEFGHKNSLQYVCIAGQGHSHGTWWVGIFASMMRPSGLQYISAMDKGGCPCPLHRAASRPPEPSSKLCACERLLCLQIRIRLICI